MSASADSPRLGRVALPIAALGALLRPRGAPLASRGALLATCGALLLAGCGTSPSGGTDGVAATASTTTGDVASPDGGAGAATPGATTVTITAADLPPLAPVAASLAPDAPERIVSLATGVGETLVALGVGDRVVGRDETSAVPADAEVVTKAHNVSAEKVIALNPDVVIVDARTTPPEALDQIAAAGAKVVEVPEAWTLADMAPRTQAVAAAVGADPTALLATLPADATASPGPAVPSSSAPGDSTPPSSTPPSSTPSSSPPRVAFLYLRGTSAIYLLGGKGSGADALIAAAGGVDVGAEAGYDAFVPLTAEAIAELNPDVLLVMTKGMESVNGVDGLVALPGVAQTTAGRERRVIAVDDEILLSFGPRTGALIDRLRAALAQVAP